LDKKYITWREEQKKGALFSIEASVRRSNFSSLRLTLIPGMNCEFITILLQSPLFLIYFCRVSCLIYLHNKNPQQRASSGARGGRAGEKHQQYPNEISIKI